MLAEMGMAAGVAGGRVGGRAGGSRLISLGLGGTGSIANVGPLEMGDSSFTIGVGLGVRWGRPEVAGLKLIHRFFLKNSSMFQILG